MKKVKALTEEFCKETNDRINKGDPCLQDEISGEFYSYRSHVADKFITDQIQRSTRLTVIWVVCLLILLFVFVLICVHQTTKEVVFMPR